MKRHTILVELKIDSTDDSDKVNERVEALLEQSAIKSAFDSAGLSVVAKQSLVALRAVSS